MNRKIRSDEVYSKGDTFEDDEDQNEEIDEGEGSGDDGNEEIRDQRYSSEKVDQ